jgi:hypothetical protein
MTKQLCPICGVPVVDIDVYLPACGNVRFCRKCLLAFPGAIVEAVAELAVHPDL